MTSERERSVANTISARRGAIAADVTARVFAQWPELDVRYGAAGRAKCTQDAEYHLTYLEQALALGSADLFADYVDWAQTMLSSRGLPESDLAKHLRILVGVVAEHVAPEEVTVLERIVDAAFARLRTLDPIPAMSADSPAGKFLDALRQRGPKAATSFVSELLDTGVPLKDIYVGVLQPALHEIGRLWQLNEIGVAEEHYYTAATQLVMAHLYERLFAEPTAEPTIVIACVPGELHEVGARMVADLLQSHGFTTFFLGANLPTKDLVKFVADRRASVVGLSTTFTPHLSRAAETIAALRSDARTSGVKIVVGGYPYTRVSELWRRLGADGFAADAEDAVRLIGELSGRGR
ncbi:MAG TPA: cobalamin-dependent protein [Casimicrobiaceae bacterium]|nr:cobalamin-dependent protein [Casimicrobiaceae bacterium]